MNNLTLSLRRERRLLVLLALVCLALLAGALYLQYVKTRIRARFASSSAISSC